MAREKILLIDDEEDILELLKFNLTKNGYNISISGNGEQALKLTKSNTFDLIVLDLMLPGVGGLDLCKILKSNLETKKIPIIMVTAKGEESDIVIGLELGADDYITKPFSPRVLVSRIRAVLRRHGKGEEEQTQTIKFNGFEIDPKKHKVIVNGKNVELTHTEFAILAFLASHPGWVFTRYQIIDNVKGDGYPITDRSVDVQIVGLRKKIGDYSEIIETVRGVGYRFREIEQE